ncbi:MAG: ABC transporter permease [Bacteroidetes bacterium]|nr:ABC transporter permease [Bacteroidota bacterium]
MFKLFQIEWLKIKSYKTFWILFLAFLIFFPLAFYFSASKYMESLGNSGKIEEQMLKAMIESPFVFPKVWQSSSWMGGLFFILLGMLYILLITNEVQYRTHRQNIIDGWSRVDFLKAKFSILIFFVLVSTALVFLCGLLVGVVFSKSGFDLTGGMYYVGYFALMATLYLMLGYLIAILVKRTGLAIIIYFAIVCIVDNVLWVIFTLRDSQIGYYMPLEVVDSLVPNPFKPRAIERRTVSDMSLIIAACVYLSVYVYVVINYFRKSDLKT